MYPMDYEEWDVDTRPLSRPTRGKQPMSDNDTVNRLSTAYQALHIIEPKTKPKGSHPFWWWCLMLILVPSVASFSIGWVIGYFNP